MPPRLIVDSLNGLEVALSISSLVLLVRARSLGIYWPMLPIISWRLIPYCLLMGLRKTRVLSAQSAYQLYFSTYWICYAIAALSAMLLTYTIFGEVLRPLKGLQRLGSIVYRWTAFVSVALALSALLYKDPVGGNTTAFAAVQFERSTSVIVLSLITFVGFSIRPLGLSARSRVFGLSLGLTFLTLVTLLASGSIFQNPHLFSATVLWYTIANCMALSVWVYYFWVPEPQRRFILLPTTSPFHAWNQISEILGHDPGYVAIAGVPPESFAPAELDIFGKASKNMAKVEAGDLPPSRPAAYYINLNGQKLEDSYKAPKE